MDEVNATDLAQHFAYWPISEVAYCLVEVHSVRHGGQDLLRL